MRELLVLTLGALVAVVCGDAPYTTKYDGVDIDKILANDRILNQYIRCLMGEGSCTNEGRELKRLLPDALATGCAKCNDKQKAVSEKVIRHIVQHKPQDWARLTAKYDPQGVFKQKYEKKFRPLKTAA